MSFYKKAIRIIKQANTDDDEKNTEWGKDLNLNELYEALISTDPETELETSTINQEEPPSFKSEEVAETITEEDLENITEEDLENIPEEPPTFKSKKNYEEEDLDKAIENISNMSLDTENREDIFKQAMDVIKNYNDENKIKKISSKNLLLIYTLLEPEEKYNEKYLPILKMIIEEIYRRGIEPDEKITIEKALDAAKEIITLTQDGRLEQGISTDPTNYFEERHPKYKKDLKFSDFMFRKFMNRDLQALSLDNQNTISLIQDFIATRLPEESKKALAQWRLENGLPEEDDSRSSIYDDTKLSTNMQKILNLFNEYIKIKNISIDGKNEIMSPNSSALSRIFYALLNKINEEDATKFAQNIYALFMEQVERKNIYSASRFITWLIYKIKNMFIFINSQIPNKLTESEIQTLVASSGYFIDKIIIGSMTGSNKEYFKAEVDNKLKTDIATSRKKEEWIKAYMHKIPKIEHAINIIGLIISRENFFKYNSFEAKAINSYYYTYGDENITTGLTTSQIEKLKQEGILVTTNVDDLNFKCFINTNSRTITFVTQYPDLGAESGLKQALNDLKIATTKKLNNPNIQTEWEKKVLQIGRKRLGQLEAEKEISSLQNYFNKTIDSSEEINLRKKYEDKYKNMEIKYISKYDQEGNERELSEEEIEINSFSQKLFEAATEVINQKDLYYLAATFQVGDKIRGIPVINATKLTDVQSMNTLIQYGVREPGILAPYRNVNNGEPII